MNCSYCGGECGPACLSKVQHDLRVMLDALDRALIVPDVKDAAGINDYFRKPNTPRRG